ncbi:hypothetical protein AWB85_08610 [Mycobacteroides immunogenum]|uniref:NAD-dependent epimerase/dehydratase domain-containing protein n=1 Tax=Mycobacteroides immunogenum TaxID=83262 RepID=A0A179VAC6_9MYCO|nr:NAD-dependent epimerase/dehydratase family protein [Mycobacteroides immunogenum]OAT67931.1 hypothetical protein AWB85_08610 [Mycobacteroides immunogenum]
MRCLVTGATGFVGTNLVQTLVADGHQVLATGAPGSPTQYLADLDVEVQLADLLDRDRLPGLVKGQDWVFHVAGDTSTWSGLAERRRRVNIEAADALADAAVKAGVGKFILTSTVDVHGYNHDGSPLAERFGDRSLLGIGYDYADTKAAGEMAVLRHVAHGLDVVVIYPGFMIGPFDHTMQFGRIIRSMQSGDFTFAPPGGASFCDVRSVARGMVSAAEHGQCGEGYNLTGHNRSYYDVYLRTAELVHSKRTPIRLPAQLLRGYGELAAAVSRFTGRAPEMDPGLAKYLSVPQASDFSKAREHLGYAPGDVDTAIIDAADWYDRNLPQ